jgi:transketolase N-terminal domain/subunit
MSQNYTPVLALPLKLTATVAEYTFVDLSGANATAAAYAFGIADQGGVSGDVIKTQVQGTSRMKAAAAIAKGALIEVGAGGQGTTKASGIAVARAMEAAAGPGSIIEVLLLPN